jgi:predicted  nucleic acid-binding Zn-ribbon protein
MHDSRKSFTYSLDSLLKKRNFDHDLLLLELRQAKQALDEKAVELEAAMNAVTDIEEQVRRAQSEEAIIDPERIRSMTLFLRCQCAAVKETTEQLRQLESIHQQIREQIRKTRQSIKSLEKNKTNKKKQFIMTQQRANFVEMDDLWLTKTGDS